MEIKVKTLIRKKENKEEVEFFAFRGNELSAVSYPKLFNPETTMQDIEKYLKLMFSDCNIDLSNVELVDATVNIEI